MFDTLIVYHKLQLILESIDKVETRLTGISVPDDFLLSESGMMVLDSICMKLTAIGESVKGLDKTTNKELLVNYPEIPWKRIMGVRDIIVHHYFDVDAEEIFRICKEDLPFLREVIVRMLNDLSGSK